ncbi:hypothetical protein BOO30_17105 [Vibrio navarrensis]|nr:hypothetical protein [Vibrio navarrensis]MBE4598086.1 hypothetical protein [Vibrio navarrensis]MBE4599575.1 hypothetical protein [Vibrio navarrensis]
MVWIATGAMQNVIRGCSHRKSNTFCFVTLVAKVREKLSDCSHLGVNLIKQRAVGWVFASKMPQRDESMLTHLLLLRKAQRRLIEQFFAALIEDLKSAFNRFAAHQPKVDFACGRFSEDRACQNQRQRRARRVCLGQSLLL